MVSRLACLRASGPLDLTTKPRQSQQQAFAHLGHVFKDAAADGDDIQTAQEASVRTEASVKLIEERIQRERQCRVAART